MTVLATRRGKNWNRELIKKGPEGNTFRHEIALRPINYKNKSGVYVPITNVRVLSTSQAWAYELSEGLILRQAPRTIGPMMQFGMGSDLILFDPVEAHDVAIADGLTPNEVKYSGVWPGVDIHVFNSGHFIYIELRGSLQGRTVQFDITTPPRSYDIFPGRIQFKDLSGKLLYHLPLRFEAWDSTNPNPDSTIPIQASARVVQGKIRITAVVPDIIGIDRLHPTLTLQPDATDGLDTFMAENTPTTNYETNAWLRFGEAKTAANAIQRGLIKFDLTPIPAGATITSATLTHWLGFDGSTQADSDNTVHVYRCLRDWIENQATWNIWSTGNSWTTAGADGIGTDRESTSRGSVLCQTTDLAGAQKDISLDTALIQNVVDGIWANQGWVQRGATELNDLYYLNSSDHTTAAERPKLVVVYTVPAGSGMRGHKWYRT